MKQRQESGGRHRIWTAAGIFCVSFLLPVTVLSQVEQRPAYQVGRLSGNAESEGSFTKPTGNAVTVKITGRYEATFGIPMSLTDRGIRMERKNGRLIVTITDPVLLLTSVDTASIMVTERQKQSQWWTVWISKWNGQAEAKDVAVKRLSDAATSDAADRLAGSVEAKAMARAVMRDHVLDMIGFLYGQQTKRELASRVDVVFEGEEPNIQVIDGLKLKISR